MFGFDENLADKVKTLRYYEKIKLIPMSTRTENGYRHYSKDVLLRVLKILDLHLNK